MTHKWQNNRFPTSRRRFLGSAAGAATLGAFWSEQDLLGWQQNVRTASKPSDLRITDLRVAHVVGAPMRCPLIRLETNQGIHGLGEVRDGASPTYALMLKSRLIGENPCDVDRIFRKIKQFGFHARQAGGVCGIEMALWDLAYKAYNVPAYQMLGGVPRFDPPLLRHHRITRSQNLRPETQAAPRRGLYLPQDGSRRRSRREDPGRRHRPLGVTSRNTPAFSTCSPAWN